MQINKYFLISLFQHKIQHTVYALIWCSFTDNVAMDILGQSYFLLVEIIGLNGKACIILLDVVKFIFIRLKQFVFLKQCMRVPDSQLNILSCFYFWSLRLMGNGFSGFFKFLFHLQHMNLKIFPMFTGNFHTFFVIYLCLSILSIVCLFSLLFSFFTLLLILVIYTWLMLQVYHCPLSFDFVLHFSMPKIL